MPTKKPRITVTLEPRTHEVLSRLAAIGGGSMSSIISNLVDGTLPPLERMVVVLERAASAPQEVRAGLAAAFERAERTILPSLIAAHGMGDLFLEDMELVAPAGQYSALDPSGKRVFLPIGKCFNRQGYVVDVAPPVPAQRARGVPTAASGTVGVDPDPRLVTRGSGRARGTGKGSGRGSV